MNELRPVLADEGRRQVVDLLKVLGERPRPACLATAQDTPVERAHLFHTTQDARQSDTMILCDPSLPAALVLQRDQVQTCRDFIRDTLQISVHGAG